jgi:ATP-dependent RNA helicase HelY
MIAIIGGSANDEARTFVVLGSALWAMLVAGIAGPAWSVLEDRERELGLPLTGDPDAGMAWMMHRWASGQRLDTVLRGQDIAAGDFVRRCKQVVDLLGQIADAAPDTELRRTARKAVDGVLRGVVAADRLD